MEKKHLIILAGVGAAILTICLVNKNKKTKTNVVDEIISTEGKYEGKNIAEGNANGEYAGGLIYLVKDGKKMPYGNNEYPNPNGLNWNSYCETNEECNSTLLYLTKEELDTIPDA